MSVSRRTYAVHVPAVHRLDDSCIAAHLGERAVRSLDPDAMSVMGPGQGGARRGALSGDEEEDGGSGSGAFWRAGEGGGRGALRRGALVCESREGGEEVAV